MDIFLTVIIVFIIVLFCFVVPKLNEKDKRQNYAECFSENNSTKTKDVIHACQSMAILSTKFVNPVYEVINKEFRIDDNIIKLDLNIVALFWARLRCTLGCNDETAVKAITRAIITYFSFEAEKQFNIKQEKFIEVADNRLPVFDKIYMTSTDSKDFLTSMLTELGILLAHDIVNNGYEPFTLSSPMPIIGLDKQSLIDLSITEFISNYDEAINSHILSVRKVYRMD